MMNSHIKMEQLATIIPAFSTDNVPIAVSCSEYFSPYAAAFLKSLARFTSASYNYDILVFTKDICTHTEEMLRALLEEYKNISLRFIDITPYLSQYSLMTYAHFGVESYFRLLFPYILTSYQKLLYFDCDMVVRHDVAELFQIDIGTNFLGGCSDYVVIGAIHDPDDKSCGDHSWKEYCKQKLGMTDPYQYLNSGVLIFNLERFRQAYTADQLLKNAQEKQYHLLDQDALNAMCAPDITIIDAAWNMTTDVGGGKIPYIKKGPERFVTEYFSSREHPCTVHFADWSKPWKNPNEDMSYEFWEDARTLPCYVLILSRMGLELLDRVNITTLDPVSISQPMGVLGEWKYVIKRWSTLVLPYGSRRRRALKKLYFKLWGWAWQEG